MVRTIIDHGGAIKGDPGTDDMLQYMEDMDGAQITIEVELAYAMVDGATPNASRWVGALNSMFPNLNHGIKSVRPIAGTTTLSQHSYGNAVDTFASWPTMDAIFNWGVANASAFSIRLLILRDVQWSGGIGHYDGIYHNHVHADFYPEYPL